jgi:hypothetical protein
VKESRTHDPFTLDLRGEEFKTRVAPPKDRPLPIPAVHQNERGLALTMGNNDPVGFNSRELHFVLLYRREPVVPDLSHVARLEPPSGTGHYGAGDLATRENVQTTELQLGIESGEMWQANNRIGGIQAHSGNVYNRESVLHRDTLRENRAGASKKDRILRLIIFTARVQGKHIPETPAI